MEIFISQSGPRSQAIADALGTFIKKVIPGTTCWVSSKDIDKGARFEDAIKTSLGQSTAGIVSLTSENLNARWILYEAGALSTKGVDRLWTFLLDIGHSKVQPPLSPFQHTNAHDREDVLKMIKSIYQKIPASERVVDEPQVEDYFDKYWPTHLEPQIAEQLAKGAPTEETKQDAQTETLALVRQLVDNAGRTTMGLQRLMSQIDWALASGRMGVGMGAGIARSGTLRDLAGYNYVYPGAGVLTVVEPTPLPLRAEVTSVPAPKPKAEPPEHSGE